MRDSSRPYSVGGTSGASQPASHTQRPCLRTSRPLPARLRTISSTNSGLPPARAATKSRNGARPSSAMGAPSRWPTSARASSSPSGPSSIIDVLGAQGAQRARIGALQDQQHQGPVRQLVDDLAQQVDRGRVGPVQVVDDHHDRLLRQPPLEQRARRQRDLALQLLGLDVAGPGLLDAEQVVQHLRHRIGLVRIGAEGPQALLQLAPGRLQRVGLLDAVGLAEQRAEGAVGRLAERRAGGAAHAGRREPVVAFEPREQLGEQARLARAGLADHADELGLAALHAVERGQQALDRRVAPDQRRRQPEVGEAARGGQLRAHADQAMNPHRLRLAAQRQLDGRLEGEAVPHQGLRRVRHQHRARLGGREQARGGVHGVAGDGVGAAGAAAPGCRPPPRRCGRRCAASPAARGAPPTAGSGGPRAAASPARPRSRAAGRPRAHAARRTPPSPRRRRTSRRSRRSARWPAPSSRTARSGSCAAFRDRALRPAR